MCVHFGGDGVFMSVGCVWMVLLIFSSVERTADPMGIHKGEYHLLSSTGIYRWLFVSCCSTQVCPSGGDIICRGNVIVYTHAAQNYSVTYF